MRAGLALIVLVLDVVALNSLFGSRVAAGRRLAWCAAIVLLPLFGAGAWLVRGRARAFRASDPLADRAE